MSGVRVSGGRKNRWLVTSRDVAGSEAENPHHLQG